MRNVFEEENLVSQRGRTYFVGVCSTKGGFSSLFDDMQKVRGTQ